MVAEPSNDIQSDDSKQSVAFMEQLRVEAQVKINAERPSTPVPPGRRPRWGEPIGEAP
jgi:hypothetical protein